MKYVAKPIPKQPEIQREFQRLAEAWNGIHDFDVLHAAPPRPRAGMVRYADGTDWNPGSGEGPYYYEAATSSWIPMFGGGGGITNEALYSYTDTTDITGIGNGTIGYITLGTINIPTSGYILLDHIVVQIDVTGSSTTYPFLGLQINSTNYVLGDLERDDGSGFYTQQPSMTISPGTKRRCLGTWGNDTSTIFGAIGIDIDQSGCSTGNQTVKLYFDNVVSASTRIYAVRGSTGITTRISLRVVDLS